MAENEEANRGKGEVGLFTIVTWKLDMTEQEQENEYSEEIRLCSWTFAERNSASDISGSHPQIEQDAVLSDAALLSIPCEHKVQIKERDLSIDHIRG